MPTASQRLLAGSDESGRSRGRNSRRAASLLAVVGLVLAAIGAPSVRAQNATTTVTVGGYPSVTAVNPVTNRIYVEIGGDNVAVIDGATNAAATIAAGSAGSVAVNPVTNRIYVSNGPFSGIPNNPHVTVIDGDTNSTAIIAAGSAGSLAVNPVTNKIYASYYGGTTVIDGATNATTTLSGTGGSIAVNPVTNRIYVGNTGSASVTVIDGATNAATTVTLGYSPGPIAVNPVTNKIYVGCGNNLTGNNVAVIDGATNATTTVNTGSYVYEIAVNPVTNRIYGLSGNTVTVIDGATNESTGIMVGFTPQTIAVSPVTNRIYVADLAGSEVTVIDGTTNAATSIAVGSNPQDIQVNPATGRVYVANNASASVTVIDEAAATASMHSARLINISARAQVGTGGNILIPGFVVSGSGTETLLIRGAGPGLTQFGVSGALAQPSLSVFDSSGTRVASNTGWGTNANPAQIAGVAAQVGAFAFTVGSADCALMVSLPAGAYTVQISGVNNTTGVALAEVYEASPGGTRLVNISTRAQVGTGGDIIIAGFVVSGTGSEELLLRADGPALSQFGVSGVLGQPSMSVFDRAGVAVASNTGWATNPDPGMTAGFAADVGAFPLSPGSSGIASSDSAQFVRLPPGAYTMQVSGTNNSTGNALAEIYEVP